MEMPTEPDKPARRTKKLPALSASAEQPREPAAYQQAEVLQEPPPFSEAYYRAHRNYLLFSSLLVAWSVVEVRPEGIPYLGAVIGNAKAIPVILFVLVIYSGTKLVIEWLESSPARQKRRPARIDFWLSHWIGTFSLILYAAYQEAARNFALVQSIAYDFGSLTFWLLVSAAFFFLIFHS